MSKTQLSFNEALANLENISERISNDEIDIDELSDILKQAAGLVKICKEKITKAESEVTKILKQIDISSEEDAKEINDKPDDLPGEEVLPDDDIPF